MRSRVHSVLCEACFRRNQYSNALASIRKDLVIDLWKFGTRPQPTVELLLRNAVMVLRPLLTGEFPIFPNLGLKIQFPIHMETFPASLFSVRDENDMLVKRKISVGSRKSSADFYAVS